MAMTKKEVRDLAKQYGDLCRKNDALEADLYTKYDVKRGLRDLNGRGVVTGITNISRVESTEERNGEIVPCPGRLFYRGYKIEDLIHGISDDNRFGFEEVAYLLLFGELPNKDKLKEFRHALSVTRRLPTNFVRDVIMKATSEDIMNSLTRSVLTLASYDTKMADSSVENVIRQCTQLIGTFPMLSVYAYHAFNHYKKYTSLYIHRPSPQLSTSENFLRMLRPNKKYTKLEAKVLDLSFILHMEHGGGNNSTFTTRVVTSAGSDTYSTIAAALSSLKGSRHGGANVMVVKMVEDIKKNVEDISDREQVKEYLRKILRKETFDKKGLIYGMGHAVYSISDPRAKIFKKFVKQLADEKGKNAEYNLHTLIEELAPEVIAEERHIYKGVSANVDFYSGLVYSMLNIPEELYTPMFAVARIVGWSAHRIEELVTADKIMRPAYVSNCGYNEYIDLKDRK
ncbi:MAG: citrate/2-methylcitrate synthase [Eubacterium sp.]|nr:citrate/2-methylcitrate synthase [Eubacterium sp.]